MTEASAVELLFRPVDELAGAVRAGELSARELVGASLDRIAALNPRLNAFVDVFADDALGEAARIAPGDPRPFAGVPIAIKNNRGVAGRRLTYAAELMGDHIATEDHAVVRRLRDAGFVIVGTTTLPEWGGMSITASRRFGMTHNPWDLRRTPGGSSGGSAVAVAAGMVPLAHANDGGGSTRIPAACCGLVGLKPQRGRISLAPDHGPGFLYQDGVLTRTVRETALLLDVLAGPEPGDPWWAPVPQEPFAAAAAQAPAPRRIALVLDPPFSEVPVDPLCLQATRDAADLLRALGHEVQETTAPFEQPGLLEALTAVAVPTVAAPIAQAAARLGRAPHEHELERFSWTIWQMAQGIDSVQAMTAQARLVELGRAIVVWAAQYDAVLTPALAEPPLLHGEVDPMAEDPMAALGRAGRFSPWSSVGNVMGSPALSLPLGVRPDHDAAAGVPLAVQLIGQPAGEVELLALAAQLEAASAWSGRRPPL